MSITATATRPTTAALSSSTLKGGTGATSSHFSQSYDLTKAETDFATIKGITIDYTTNILGIIDQEYNLRNPDTPYLGPLKGPNRLKQTTHPGLTFFVEKGMAYVLGEDMSVYCSEAENPMAPARFRRYAERLIKMVFDWAHDMAPGWHDVRRMCKLLFLEGGVALEGGYLAGPDAASYNSGYPLKLDVHSLRHIAYRFNGKTLTQLWVMKKRLVGDLPDEYLTGSLADAQPTQEVTLTEYWDQTSFGVANGQEEIVPLGPHGYVDCFGQGFIPYTIGFFDPTEWYRGGQTFNVNGIDPVSQIVGMPPVWSLVNLVQDQSFALTLWRKVLIDNGIPEKIITGPPNSVHYDPNKRTWTAANKDSSVQVLEMPQAHVPTQQYMQYLDMLFEEGAANRGMMSGAQSLGQSGHAMMQQTQTVKRVWESVGEVLQDTLSRHSKKYLWMVGTNTQSSVAQKVHQQYGTTFNLAAKSKINKSQPLPYSTKITQNPSEQIVDFTFRDIDHVKIRIAPYNKLPDEQRVALGSQMAIVEEAKLDVTKEFVWGELLGFSNAGTILAAKKAQNLTAQNPTLAQIDAYEAHLIMIKGEIPEDEWNQLSDQWVQTKPQAIFTASQQIQQQMLQSASQSAPPYQHPGAPTGQGGPPQAQGIGPAFNGAPAGQPAPNPVGMPPTTQIPPPQVGGPPQVSQQPQPQVGIPGM
jgi:hypothetical protein